MPGLSIPPALNPVGSPAGVVSTGMTGHSIASDPSAFNVITGVVGLFAPPVFSIVAGLAIPAAANAIAGAIDYLSPATQTFQPNSPYNPNPNNSNFQSNNLTGLQAIGGAQGSYYNPANPGYSGNFLNSGNPYGHISVPRGGW